jgi:hypothetical protein
MQAAVADVAEHARDPPAVAVGERLDVAQVRAHALGRDGRVLPRRPARVLAGDLAVPDAPLADLPDLRDLL